MQIQAGTEIAEQEATEEQEGQIVENADENSGQVVAQLIEAGEPAPGGEYLNRKSFYCLGILLNL